MSVSAQDMTPEQLLEAAMDGTLPLDSEAEQAAPQAPQQPASNQADDAPQDGQDDDPLSKYPEGTPIASKSGAYSIPYDELAKARERAKAAELQVAQLQTQLQEALTPRQQENLEQAQAAAQERAEAGATPTQSDENLATALQAIAMGVDSSVFGDYSEESLAKGVAHLNAQMASVILNDMNAKVDAKVEELLGKRLAALEPLIKKEQENAQQAHLNAIYTQHPDANEVVASREFAGWKENLPEAMRAAVDTVMTEGTTQEIIKVFDSFKAAVAPQKQHAPTGVGQVLRKAPISLSDVSGAPHRDLLQATLANAQDNPVSLLSAVEEMTAEQLDRLMNSV